MARGRTSRNNRHLVCHPSLEKADAESYLKKNMGISKPRPFTFASGLALLVSPSAFYFRKINDKLSVLV
jgi:hypothetical protein